MECELWKLLYAIVARLGRKVGSWKFSAADILLVYFWAAIHDRPMYWAVDKRNWPNELCPVRLPSQSTLSRRMRRSEVQQLMTEVENTWLAVVNVAGMWIKTIDGKPLAVSGVTKDADAGYGRGAGGMQKGYKFYAVWASGPLPIAWELAPMNKSEKTVAGELIPTLPGGGYLLGDSEYDSNKLHELTHAAEHQLVTPKRQKHRGVGHRPQSTYRLRSIELMNTDFGKNLFRFRRQIERNFGNLTSFGGGLTCLPAWVRRFHRVRNWVHAKLLINAARWFRKNHAVLAVA
jgi:Transposase DDE domain